MLILSSNPVPLEFDERIRALIERAGGTWIPSPEPRDERIALIDRHIHEADVFFGGRLSDEQLERAARLRWIHVPWAGVNTILSTKGIRDRELLITNSSGVMADSVADHVLGVMVMLARDLAAQVHAQARHEWISYETESPKRRILRGATVGIVGFGAIGSEVARRARAFGMRVVATRRNTDEVPPEVDDLFGPSELDRLLEASDYVVIAVPLTSETRGMVGASQLRRMKRDAWLINIARGAVVNEDELIDALRSGTIAGAALDVFAREPLPADSPLWDMPNVIVTPHSSGAFHGYRDAAAALFLENLRRYLEGEELVNVVRDGY